MIEDWFHDNSPREFMAAAARSAESGMRDIWTAMEKMQDRIDRLTCFSWTLWRLLQDRTDVTDEQILQDLRQVTREAHPVREQRKKALRCPECERPILRYKPTCAYCGAVVPEPGLFESLF